VSDKRQGRAPALFDNAAFAEDLGRASAAGEGVALGPAEREGKSLLAFAAFGVRHHPAESNAPTVYEVAHAT
jgi:hypothetical protein